MKHRVEFHWILLILVMMVCATQGKKRETAYTGLQKCETVRGAIAVEFKAKSSVECSLRLVVIKIPGIKGQTVQQLLSQEVLQ